MQTYYGTSNARSRASRDKFGEIASPLWLQVPDVFAVGSISNLSLDEEWQGRMHFFQGSPSRFADFKFFSNTDIANLSGLTAAEVGFLVVKPFKKHPFLACGARGGQTENAPLLLEPVTI